MIGKTFLILSAILIAVSAVTLFFNAEKARMTLGAGMVAFSLHIICFIIWRTEVERKRD